MEQNLDAFWYNYRAMKGFDPTQPMTFEEEAFWLEVEERRTRCSNTEDPIEAITEADTFDKQQFLARNWSKLNEREKKLMLEHVFLNKGDGLIYGYEWWIPYFEEVGYYSNINKPRPEEPIVLYRGSAEVTKYGVSWTNEEKIARIFAEYKDFIHFEKHVFKAVIPPRAIMGHYKGTGGHPDDPSSIFTAEEFVVNPRIIQNLKMEIISTCSY